MKIQNDLSDFEKNLLSKRRIIETIIGQLKIKFSLIHTRFRSISSFLTNTMPALLAYALSKSKPRLDLIFNNNFSDFLIQF